MDTHNEIRLRLRFYREIEEDIDRVLHKFNSYAANDHSDFNIKIQENHIWFYVVGTKKKYWSPHLHLKFDRKSEKVTRAKGLFGPDQTLWTLFMFLHFIVAGVFAVFATFAYTNYASDQPMTVDLTIMLLMVIVWFLLYFVARQVRSNASAQMDEIEQLFLKIVEK